MQTLTVQSLARSFREIRQTTLYRPGAISAWSEQSGKIFIDSQSSGFRNLDSSEVEAVLLESRALVESENLRKAGRHRREDWEKGWSENEAFLDSVPTEQALRPLYFSEQPALARIGGKLVQPQSSFFEQDLLAHLVDGFLGGLVKQMQPDTLYEFGCGTGQHLLRLNRQWPEVDLVGLDWAESSQRLLKKMAHKVGTSKLAAANFDFYNPDLGIEVSQSALFYTVAALEQVGSEHHHFIDFVLSKRPRAVFHVEPIAELLPDGPLESASIAYFRARNYLDGFLDELYAREKRGQLEVISAERTGLGSKFIEGYSTILWRPV